MTDLYSDLELSSTCHVTCFGIDFSQEAIQMAQSKNLEKVEFLCADILQVKWSDESLIVGLGLLDWLSAQELKVLRSLIKNNHFLFCWKV